MCRGGGTGRRTGLKILGLATGVRVRFPPSALILKDLREWAFYPNLPFWPDFARNFARKYFFEVSDKLVRKNLVASNELHQQKGFFGEARFVSAGATTNMFYANHTHTIAIHKPGIPMTTVTDDRILPLWSKSKDRLLGRDEDGSD
jgi:hypothetical protein